jgi:hypothetical protein
VEDKLPSDSRPSQRTEDNVSGMAIAWTARCGFGCPPTAWPTARRRHARVLATPAQVSSVAVDPLDGSVWVGGRNGGLTRIEAGVFTDWSEKVPGGEIPDIQVDRSGAQRRIVVSFKRGTVGIYDGP